MKDSKLESLLRWWLLLAIPAISVFISAGSSTDPINISKMFLLIPVSMSILFSAVLNFRYFFQNTNKYFSALLILFALDLIFVAFMAGAPTTQQVFGVFGRNTGLLTYFSFAVLTLAIAKIASEKYNFKILLVIMFTGSLNVFYGLIQILGIDPIKWNNPYSSAIGFLGNPNFLSSFLGITSIIAFTYLFSSQKSLFFNFFSIAYILASIFIIIRSGSQQGILVFLGGVVVSTFIYVLKSEKLGKPLVVWLSASIFSVMGIITILGTLNVGPLGELLYKVSVRQRGYYWNAAIEMMKLHPFSGVGLDSYGDWYLGVRSFDAGLNSPGVTSNAAHNVVLEFGAVGGFPLLIIYVLLISITFISGINFIKRARSFNWVFTSIFAGWVGFTAQSIISINQIGLAIWGWVLMGLIVGTEYSARIKEPKLSDENKISQRKFQKNEEKFKILNTYILASVGLIFGFVITSKPFVNDASYRTALASKNAEAVINSVNTSPRDITRMLMAAEALANSNLTSQAEKLVDEVIRINPRYYNAWSLKLKLVGIKSEDTTQIIKKMNLLNPQAKIK
jgi:O-antigen ligase